MLRATALDLCALRESRNSKQGISSSSSSGTSSSESISSLVDESVCAKGKKRDFKTNNDGSFIYNKQLPYSLPTKYHKD